MASFESMSKALVEHARLEHGGDYDATMRTMTEDCYQEHSSLGLRVEGQEPCKSYYAELFYAFPDFGSTLDGTASSSDAIVVWGTLRGTMSGNWLGFEATHQQVELPIVVIVKFRGDLLVGESLHYDGATFCRQLGLDYDAVLAAAQRMSVVGTASA
jgi:predicted ester cyclase